ncbi:MAG: hypothetical protein FRX49_13213 [Trebouxia sp. A1-2]|nr:MAG: hypothetical protein FRX49_13213 [Trebouxia sp. A1-2]
MTAAEGVLPHEETCDHNRVRNHMGDSDQLSVIYPPHQRLASELVQILSNPHVDENPEIVLVAMECGPPAENNLPQSQGSLRE